jgi:Mg-chelatase subunit ChlD
MKMALALAVFAASALVSAPGQGNVPCIDHEALVSVANDSYQTVPEVTVATLHAEVHGRPIEIREVAPFTASRRTVIVLDGSGSMRDKWQFALSAVTRIVARASGNLFLAFVSLTGGKTQEIGFSKTGRVEIADLLRQYAKQPNVPSGESPLVDGIESALDLLTPAKPGDSIYLVSDGGENKSKEAMSKLQSKLLVGHVRLFSFLLFDEGVSTEEERDGFTRFQRLSEESGGIAITAKDPNSFKKLYDALGTIIESQAVLHLLFRVPGPIEKPTPWKLQFVDASGKPVKRVRVQYAHTLLPCEMK